MNGRLKQLRKALNLKQGDFAAALSISQGHLSDVETDVKKYLIELLVFAR